MKFYALYRFNTFVKKGKYTFDNLPKIYCIGILANNIFKYRGVIIIYRRRHCRARQCHDLGAGVRPVRGADLHAAPGCQNGFDNGGIKDVCRWHTRPEYLEHSLTVLERLAEAYGRHPCHRGAQRAALGCAHRLPEGLLPAGL